MFKILTLASLLGVVASAGSVGNLRHQRILQTYDAIAGYAPGSQVTDHNAIDLDQRAIEDALSNNNFAAAERVYREGGFSKSYARVDLNTALTAVLAKGTIITGVDDSGAPVNGKALAEVAMGSVTIEIQYVTSDSQVGYVNCQVGGLFGTFINTAGCLTATGTITIEGQGQFQYSYDPAIDNDNDRTIQGFSTGAQAKMLECDNCPYADFYKFNAYYGAPDYADKWILGALQGTNAGLTNGNADFTGADPALRVEAAKKGTAYMAVWMYALREFEDALDDCKSACTIDNCNDDPVHAWDEGVAFYTGSSHGTALGSIEDGFLIYSLANKRCDNFRTCGVDGNVVNMNAKVNYDLFDLFDQGRTQLQNGQCAEARITKNQVAHLMAVPALQGTLRYAYEIGERGDTSPKAIGEGAVFAAAVLPIVHNCSAADATIIYENMKVGASGTPVYTAVKEAFERNYECMEITCADVGGYFNKDQNEYFPKAAPCIDEPLSNIAGYIPGSQVTDHNAIDLDQKAIEMYLPPPGGTPDFTNSKSVYEKGAYSKSFALVTLGSTLSVDVAKGARIVGVNAMGGHVDGKALETTLAGASSLKIQYSTNNNQTIYVDCQVGGLLPADANTDGCFAPSGTLIISGVGSVTYAYTPTTNNMNARTIKGFSTSAEEKMLTCEEGCPHPVFRLFDNYYGFPDYADKWITAAMDGTNAGLSNGNADFSSGRAATTDLRIEAVKKGTAYLAVWMYVIREFEDAVTDCNVGCNTCNDDNVHAWDEGVAFYTGSSHGTQLNSVDPGYLIYSLANKRCENFKTCGESGDQLTGNSKINIELFKLFEQGKVQLQDGQCDSASVTKESVTKLMVVPAVQGTLRYAYTTDVEKNRNPKPIGEGAIFAAAVLPLVNECSPADATTIYNNMNVANTATSFAAVKAAFERNYPCMGISCADVGGLYDGALGEYYNGAAPCSDVPFEDIAGYSPGSKVTDHNAIDLDQQAIERYLRDENFAAATRVYTQGAFSKSYAQVRVNPPLSADVPKGTFITGVSATGTPVSGKTLRDVANGATTIDIQYDTGKTQATYMSCQVGGLLATDVNTDGCFASSGSINIAGYSRVSYNYNPNTDNKNDRTIQGFSTGAQAKMYECDNGCPYPDFMKFREYYGASNYADRWISASLAGSNAQLERGNADFSSGFPNSAALRVETAKKGTAYMAIWMYVIREFEDAVGDCEKACVLCNDDPVHAWDEGVAFYTGSFHGTELNTIEPGYLIYSLANKRCENFKTCGENGNQLSGNANINIRLFKMFDEGRDNLLRSRCAAAKNRKEKIAQLMAVPSIQGTLRYAYIIGEEGTTTPKAVGEGAVFAAAVLPIVHACSPEDAAIIYDNMNVASADATSFSAVKAAFERNYKCMGIKCSDVGGYYDKNAGAYYPGAAPCVDAPNPSPVPIAISPGSCFDGESTVQVEGVEKPVALNDAKIGDSVLAANGKYEQIYSFAHYGPEDMATFVAISTDVTEKPIKISAEHMIFVDTITGQKSIPASNVALGDKLVLANGDVAVVDGIESAVESGVYAPFTKSGTIVVNGILASTYVTMQPGSESLIVGGVKTSLTYQWLGHVLQTPHRLVCQFFFHQCEAETYNSETGVSNFVQSSLDLAVWFLNQNVVVSWILFAFGLVPMLVLFILVDFVAASPMTAAAGVCTVVFARNQFAVAKKTV